MSYSPFAAYNRLNLSQVEQILAHQYLDHVEIFKRLNKHANDLENNPKLFAEIERTYPIVMKEFSIRKSCMMVLQVVYSSSR